MRILWLVIFCGSTVWGAPEKPKSPVVYVSPVKATTLADHLSYPARVQPKVNAAVLSDTDGLILKIFAPLGTEVKKNSALMRLRHTDPLYDYAPVTVRSPVNGRVSLLDVNEGSRVIKGQKLLQITDPKSLVVLIEVAASDLNAMIPGMAGTLSLPGAAQSISLRIRGISPTVDPATGTASAELEVEKAEDQAKLFAGTIGRVTFEVRKHEGIEIPEYAVIYRGNDPFVRVVEDNKTKYVKIDLGPSRRGNVEIVKGLPLGSSVVVRSSSFLAEGEEVSVESVNQGKAE